MRAAAERDRGFHADVRRRRGLRVAHPVRQAIDQPRDGDARPIELRCQRGDVGDGFAVTGLSVDRTFAGHAEVGVRDRAAQVHEIRDEGRAGLEGRQLPVAHALLRTVDRGRALDAEQRIRHVDRDA